MEEEPNPEGRLSQNHTLESLVENLNSVNTLTNQILEKEKAIKAIVGQMQKKDAQLEEVPMMHEPFTDFNTLKIAFTKCLDPDQQLGNSQESFVILPDQESKIPSIAKELAESLKLVSDLIKCTKRLTLLNIASIIDSIRSEAVQQNQRAHESKLSADIEGMLPAPYLLDPIVGTVTQPPIFEISGVKLETSVANYSHSGWDNFVSSVANSRVQTEEYSAQDDVMIDDQPVEPMEIIPLNLDYGNPFSQDDGFMEIPQLNFNVFQTKPLEQEGYNQTMEDIRARMNELLFSEDEELEHDKRPAQYRSTIRQALDDLLKDETTDQETFDNDQVTMAPFARSLKCLEEYEDRNAFYTYKRDRTPLTKVLHPNEISANSEHLQSLWWHQFPNQETQTGSTSLFAKAQQTLFGQPHTPILRSPGQLCNDLWGLLQQLLTLCAGRVPPAADLLLLDDARMRSLLESAKQIGVDVAAQGTIQLKEGIRLLEEEWRKYSLIVEKIRPLSEELEKLKIFAELKSENGTPLTWAAANLQAALELLHSQHTSVVFDKSGISNTKRPGAAVADENTGAGGHAEVFGGQRDRAAERYSGAAGRRGRKDGWVWTTAGQGAGADEAAGC